MSLVKDFIKASQETGKNAWTEMNAMKIVILAHKTLFVIILKEVITAPAKKVGKVKL